jgi:hypothetical protein
MHKCIWGMESLSVTWDSRYFRPTANIPTTDSKEAGDYAERPSSFVPFPRDPDFINRGTLIDQIDEKCSALMTRRALVRLGGVRQVNAA